MGFSHDGTAVHVTDYAGLGGSVAIPANLTSVALAITPVTDNEADDSTPVVTIVASDPDASESGLDPGEFTVSRSGGDFGAELLVLVGRGGTAINGSDYASLGGANFFVTVPANETSATVSVTPLQDALVEPSETVVLTIQPRSVYAIGTPGQATVTLADDD